MPQSLEWVLVCGIPVVVVVAVVIACAVWLDDLSFSFGSLSMHGSWHYHFDGRCDAVPCHAMPYYFSSAVYSSKLMLIKVQCQSNIIYISHTRALSCSFAGMSFYVCACERECARTGHCLIHCIQTFISHRLSNPVMVKRWYCTAQW